VRFKVPTTSDTKDDAYGATGSPFLFSPNKRLLDKQYGIRKDSDNLIIGNSTVTVDSSCNISIRETQFKGRRICGNF